ncbi:hypothetical protein AF332_25945 [Sporosarcina globispora]|uniref:Uncharacterized protein n=1 Tax=Sporosarcina globispora TaxID=1459 RepID=A0A0M0GJ22_SPOGL|nr:CBO0543 family protein [Sporosarcina globispora]KON89925.1 hypothetical protein AF332_25945 [Sporosarcina globispora]
MSRIPSYEDEQKIRETLRDVSLEHWLNEDLFSFNWWLLLAAGILPFVIWWRLVDKGRFFEILAFGLICAIFACFLDIVGVSFLLWGYPDKLLHFIPPLVPADFVVIPISGMLIYQYFSTWKSYAAAAVGLGIMFAYIIEPLFSFWNMFVLIHWTHTNSFIGFIIFFLIVRLVMLSLKHAVEKSK